MSNETQKHTPGPWEFDSYNTILARLEGPGVEDGVAVICSIPDHPSSDESYRPEQIEERGWWYSQSAANARLIAAAPELLEALELMYDNDPLTALPLDQYRVIEDKAEAAIRKAKGEQ